MIFRMLLNFENVLIVFIVRTSIFVVRTDKKLKNVQYIKKRYYLTFSSWARLSARMRRTCSARS